MEIYELCEKLENELKGRRGVINTQVDISECRKLVSQLKSQLEVYFGRDNDFDSRKKAILCNADNVAKSVLKEAEQRAKELVKQSEIVRQAEIDSREIIDNAYENCDVLALKTKRHLDDMLKSTEDFFRDALKTVVQNRYELKNMIINAGTPQSN